MILFFLSIFVITLLVGLVYFRVREDRFLKKKTKEAIAPHLREEFEAESAEERRKKEKFQEALKRFGGESIFD